MSFCPITPVSYFTPPLKFSWTLILFFALTLPKWFWINEHYWGESGHCYRACFAYPRFESPDGLFIYWAIMEVWLACERLRGLLNFRNKTCSLTIGDILNKLHLECSQFLNMNTMSLIYVIHNWTRVSCSIFHLCSTQLNTNFMLNTSSM